MAGLEEGLIVKLHGWSRVYTRLLEAAELEKGTPWCYEHRKSAKVCMDRAEDIAALLAEVQFLRWTEVEEEAPDAR